MPVGHRFLILSLLGNLKWNKLSQDVQRSRVINSCFNDGPYFLHA
jgi:hypothetical protein